MKTQTTRSLNDRLKCQKIKTSVQGKLYNVTWYSHVVTCLQKKNKKRKKTRLILRWDEVVHSKPQLPGHDLPNSQSPRFSSPSPQTQTTTHSLPQVTTTNNNISLPKPKTKPTISLSISLSLSLTWPPPPQLHWNGTTPSVSTSLLLLLLGSSQPPPHSPDPLNYQEPWIWTFKPPPNSVLNALSSPTRTRTM